MKKLLSAFLAILFVFSIATMAVSAAEPKPIQYDSNAIPEFDFLDFNAASNALWAKEENGVWSCFIEEDVWEYPGNDIDDGLPIAPYITGSYRTGTQFSFIEGGEVLHFEITGSNDTPGLQFVVDEQHDQLINTGSESGANPKMEYFKIRVRNTSTANRFTFGFALQSTNSYKFVGATVSDLKIDMNGKEYQSASGEWETYIFSMSTINQTTDYNDLLPDANSDGVKESRWGGYMDSLLIFPFGYDVDDGTGPYVGASIDIDYIVGGSLEYVTAYKSELEKKEESITKLELVNSPSKTNYYVGDEFDLDGLVLQATYNDGTAETLTSASYDVNLETGGTNVPAKLTFGKESVSFNVNVVGVESIEVIGQPENTNYEVASLASGFTPDGYTFKVNYTDGTSRTSDEFVGNVFNCFTNDDLSTTGEKTITVNFYGKSTQFTVNAINVEDIEITAPEKAYRYKDTVSADDFTVNFVLTDGSKVAADDAEIELDYVVEVDNKSVGEVTAKITATNATYGVNITKDVVVTFDTPTALKVQSAPDKTTYEPGDTFDKTGLKVALVYADGKSIVLDESDYTARANTQTPGEVKVNIKCSLTDLTDLKLEENCVIQVEGEVVTTTSTTAATTTNAPSSSSGISSPVVIVVIVVAVLAVAGVVVFLVIKKKK